MFVRLQIYKKSLETKSSWFEQKKPTILRCWDVDSKSIQQVEFVGQLKNADRINTGGDSAQNLCLSLQLYEKSKKYGWNFLKEV